MSRFEFFTSEGLRIDGRRSGELKNFESSITTTSNFANFSRSTSTNTTYLQMGQNKVLVTINGPKEPTNRSKIDITKATLTTTINISKFSKVNRNTNKSNLPDKQTLEWEYEITQLFSKIVVLETYPKSTISINVTVLQQDGGLLSAIINCITTALINNSVQIYDIVTAVSVGIVDQKHFLLDLNHLEEQFLSSGTIATIGGSDEVCLMRIRDKFPLDLIEEFVQVGVQGCSVLKHIIINQVKDMNLNKLVEIQ
ncbi:hypothetical protein QEN19_001593 [Hanseniaspora menglaensis]